MNTVLGCLFGYFAIGLILFRFDLPKLDDVYKTNEEFVELLFLYMFTWPLRLFIR